MKLNKTWNSYGTNALHVQPFSAYDFYIHFEASNWKINKAIDLCVHLTHLLPMRGIFFFNFFNIYFLISVNRSEFALLKHLINISCFKWLSKEKERLFLPFSIYIYMCIYICVCVCFVFQYHNITNIRYSALCWYEWFL